MQENLKKTMSGVPYPSRPIRADYNISIAQQPPADVDDASRLLWKRPDDVTGGSQSATEADLDTLIDRYGRLDTGNTNSVGNLPVDAKPRSEEVQQLIKV